MNTQESTPVIAVLEWNSDSGASPIVILADDRTQARRQAVEAIIPHLPTAEEPDGEINYIKLPWVRDNPLPDLDDADAVRAWLRAFSDQTTDLWLTIYDAGGRPQTGPGNDTYIDARSQGH
jgi:hypothetical protein